MSRHRRRGEHRIAHTPFPLPRPSTLSSAFWNCTLGSREAQVHCQRINPHVGNCPSDKQVISLFAPKLYLCSLSWQEKLCQPTYRSVFPKVPCKMCLSPHGMGTDRSPGPRCVPQKLLQGLVVERRLNPVVELGQIRTLFTSVHAL